MLDPRALQSMVVLADELHFGRAAERLGITQSVLSIRIGRLEDMLGAPLFHRGKRAPVRLTRAGDLFLPEARSAVAGIEQAERIGRRAGRGEMGVLRIGHVFSAAVAGVTPALLRAVRTTLPSLTVDLRLMDTPEQIAALADGRIDVGLMRPRPDLSVDIEARTVDEEPVMLALAADHPLTKAAAINPSDLAHERFVIPQFHEEVGLIDTLRRLAAAGGFALRSIERTGDFVTALTMVAGGYGASIVPRSAAALAIDGVVYREVTGFTERVMLVLAYRPALLAPPVTALLQRLEFSAPLLSP